MKVEKYDLAKNPDLLTYSFFSSGPNGLIEKVVVFQLIDLDNNLYNLAFGDWDERANEVNDFVVSNNQDRQKVLATVAAAVVDFMRAHSDAVIFAEGSTSARTRLYQMSISIFWREINEYYDVRGFVNENWEPFLAGINYEAFLLKNK